MALWDEVKLRYSAQLLIELTNVDLPGGGTVDDTKGTRASNDAIRWFKRGTQLEFDLTDDDHVVIAARAVVTLLKEYSGRFSDVVEREKKDVKEDMEELRNLGPGKRITPHSDSELDPSDDENLLDPQRPVFDTERFSDVTPSEPPAP